MIDTDKYEGHTEGPWEWGDDEEWSKNALVVYTINGKESLGVTKPHDPKKPDAQLIADAPLLLEHVKRLTKTLELIGKNMEYDAWMHTLIKEVIGYERPIGGVVND